MSGADFEAFMRSRGPHLFRLARAMSSDQHSAEDLFQAAAERILRRWRFLTGSASPEAYFRTTLANLAIDDARRRRRRPETLVGVVPETDASDSFEGLEQRGAALGLLNRLPPRQRVVLALRVLEGLTVDETAVLLGISQGTVKSTLARGLSTLRHFLTEAQPPAEGAHREG